MLHHLIAATALAAAASLTVPAAAQDRVVRHPATPPGLILSGVTVMPGATTLYLSGQLAAPIDAAKAKLPPAEAAKLTVADYGDTRTQTISVLGKIKAILAAHGMAMADVIKLTVFVAGEKLIDGGRSTRWDEEEVVRTAARVLREIAGETDLPAMLPPRVAGSAFRGWCYA